MVLHRWLGFRSRLFLLLVWSKFLTYAFFKDFFKVVLDLNFEFFYVLLRFFGWIVEILRFLFSPLWLTSWELCVVDFVTNPSMVRKLFFKESFHCQLDRNFIECVWWWWFWNFHSQTMVYLVSLNYKQLFTECLHRPIELYVLLILVDTFLI